MAAFKKMIGGKWGKKRKEGFEENIFSDYETELDQQGSPVYVESGESSCDDSEGNGEFNFLMGFCILYIAALLKY